MVTANTKLTISAFIESPSEARWNGECEDPLVARWPDFVNYSKRLETEGPFLRGVVRQYGVRVLDAAMGIGCESIFLTKEGAQVTGNEINPGFREHAREKARVEKVELKVTAIDWRNLAKVFEPDSFDVILLLGNSLCLMQKSDDRKETLKSLREVCRPGGVVVVDQRNFDYILEQKEAVLNGYFRYGHRVMYCGTDIVGYPIAIDNDCVRFVYENTASQNILGYLDMHPFLGRELVDVFQNGGFTLESSLSDFQPLPFCPTADFYTHIFRKPTE